MGRNVKCEICNGTGLRRFRPYLEFAKPLYTEDECIHCLGHGVMPAQAGEFTVVFSVEGQEDSVDVIADTVGEAIFKAARIIGPIIDQFIGPGESLVLEVIAQ